MNIRQILEKNGIQVWDSGKNVSRGQIGIKCPFCGPSDPSHHMVISELGEIYCFRNKKHGGRNLVRLFRALRIPESAYDHLNLNTSSSEPRVTESTRKDYSGWNYFQPACESEEAVEYLRSRLFERPIEAAKQFNLRVSKEGEWAGRLLIPLIPEGWTGRSIREHIEPRYKAHTDSDGFYFYSYRSSAAILCEGAIDCMKIATVSSQFDCYGKCRIEISAALINMLREKKYMSIFSCPDSTVPYSQKREELQQLRSYCTYSDVRLVSLPEKDFGACSESLTRSTLGALYGRREVQAIS